MTVSDIQLNDNPRQQL